MAFNANTYHAHKCARSAWKALADARALRSRIRAGEAYDWEIDVVLPGLVRTAMGDMKRSVFYHHLNELEGKTPARKRKST